MTIKGLAGLPWQLQKHLFLQPENPLRRHLSRSPATLSACTWLTRPRRSAYHRGLPASLLLHVHPCVVIPRFRHAADWEPDIRRCGSFSWSPSPTLQPKTKENLGLFSVEIISAKWLKNRKLAPKSLTGAARIFIFFGFPNLPKRIISRLNVGHGLTTSNSQLVKSPSMRRPVGVKGIRFGICWSRCFFPAESPLSPPFHPHSLMSDLFARCKLGVLVSAGAATCLSTSVPSRR